MRSVTRPAAPASLEGPGSKGAKELAEARAFFGVDANRSKSFAFSAYKSEDVRDSLREMFHRKCAYCESFYDAVTPDDIEHYRPKGAVIEGGKPKKPGYWWLAMVWSNLLPSCIDCNRARGQRIVGKARKETAGKANQFPLMAGTARATAETGEASEAALLLDPTGDEPPEKHLEFLRNGTVRAAKVNGVESERGRVTIDVVALLRRGLVEARERAAGETEVAIQHVRDTMKDISDISQMKGIGKKERAAKLAELEARLARNVADIDEKTAPDKHYTAVTGAMVRAFKAEVGLP